MKTILVVEDDPGIRELVAEALAAEGYRVETAVNGNQALAAFAHHRPDAVLLDLMMPQMDGWTLVRTLRERTKWGRVPVVVMSAAYRAEDHARQIGARACLPKPFNLSDLLQTVERVARPN